MKNINNQRQNFNEDEIDLRELLGAIIQGKWIIILITTFASIAVVIYSLSLPNIYHSKALLVPTDSSDRISGAMSAYAGMANLAGLNLPAPGGDSNAVKALKKINSLSFFENNILPNISLPELMAIESWDIKENNLKFNENIYNEKTKKWVRNFLPPQKQIPSTQESFERFKGHLTIVEDKKTGFITLMIKHQSPYVAQKWVLLLIDQINSFYREKDQMEAEKAVSYLNAQIVRTSFTEIKQVIAGLIQQETQKLTLIQANQSYVFDYIDPPAVMEKKAGPKRSIICIVGAFFAAMFSILITLLKHYISKKRNTKLQD